MRRVGFTRAFHRRTMITRKNSPVREKISRRRRSRRRKNARDAFALMLSVPVLSCLSSKRHQCCHRQFSTSIAPEHFYLRQNISGRALSPFRCQSIRFVVIWADVRDAYALPSLLSHGGSARSLDKNRFELTGDAAKSKIFSSALLFFNAKS